MTEEKSIFDEAEVKEETPEETSPDEMQDEKEYEEWKPKVAKESPKEKLERRGLKEKADGKTLTIKEVFFTRPRNKNPDGTDAEPKKTQSGEKEYFPGKLGIKFEEDNLVEYYPSFHYFVNDGVMSNYAKINRGGDNEIAKLFNLAVEKMGKPADEVSDQDFYDWLVGKKVVIKTSEGVFKKNKWFRNDIVEFLN